MNNYDQYDQETQALLQGIKPLSFEEIIGNKQQNKFRTNDSVLSSDYLSVFAKQYAFKSLTSKEITENYFNGIRPITNNNTTIIQEPETKVEIIPVYRENNGIKGFQENADKLLYKILVYISTSKDKLEDLYLKSEGRVNDNEILLFLEDNTNDFSEQYLFARFGKSIKKDDLLTAEGLAGLTSLVPDFSLDMLKELIRTGQVKSKNTITVSVAKGLLYLISLIGLPAKAIGWLCNEVGEAISKYLSVPETVWDSKGEDYFLNKENVLKELQINTSFINTLSNSLKSQDQLSWFNSFQSQEKTAQLIARPINALQEFTIAYNNEIQTIINSFYDNNSKDTQIDTLALSEQIAFLCGIWNGLVDFIAGIFKFLGMLLSAQYDIATNLNDILETIDDLWDNIKKIKFTDVLIAAVTTYFQILAEINKFFTSKNPSEQYNFDRIAYFAGFGLAFIATLFIPIADITKVSGITNVSKLIPEEFLTSLSQIKGKAINGTKPLLALAREMSEVLSKGTDEIMAFFQRIKKAIVEWFKKNKELLISVYNRAVLEGWKSLAKFFKTEKIIKATNGTEILCFSFNKALVPVDKILMYARGKVIDADNLVTLQKELADLKNLRQTARKVFEKTPLNADKIKLLDKRIENILKSLNNKKGLEKAGFIDDIHGNKNVFDYVLAVANKNVSKIKQGEWFVTTIKGPKGKATIMTQWQKLDNGKLYLKTIKIF
ncbi:hypothetical protein [Flavobacterium soli]|uniref:hypothetical protein n=1 Tax=Flavobacterium soli TaxID=344881 RepID=UPI00040EC322|nr:hypothetical protein [Flavobacterium soli]